MENLNNVFEQRNVNVFNTPLEVGLRTLFILNAINPREMDLGTLVIFDYFLLNSQDFPNGPNSIHPSIPHRSAQIIIKPPILKKGLNLMVSKDLININFTNEGIKYQSNALTAKFLEYLDNDYADKLRHLSQWINEEFSTYQLDDLELFVKNNIPNWGNEFIYESLVREYE